MLLVCVLFFAGCIRFVCPQCTFDRTIKHVNIDVQSSPSKSNISGEYWVYGTGVELICNTSYQQGKFTWFYMNYTNMHWTPVIPGGLVRPVGDNRNRLHFITSPVINKSEEVSKRYSSQYFCTFTAANRSIYVSPSITVRYPYISDLQRSYHRILEEKKSICHFCKLPGIPSTLVNGSIYWWHQVYISKHQSVFCVSFPKREFRISCYLNTTGYFGDNRQSQEVRRFNYGHAFADRSVNTTRPEEMAKLPVVDVKHQQCLLSAGSTSFSVATIGDGRADGMSCAYNIGSKTISHIGRTIHFNNSDLPLSVLCCFQAKKLSSICYSVLVPGRPRSSEDTTGNGLSATSIVLTSILLVMVILIAAGVIYYKKYRGICNYIFIERAPTRLVTIQGSGFTRPGVVGNGSERRHRHKHHRKSVAAGKRRY